MNDDNPRKITFELDQDENGYPPDKWESLWASDEGEGLYRVDNIPFYVYGISSGDLISAKDDLGELIFTEVVQPSSNTVFRLYVSDAAEMQTIRDTLKELGCESELSNLPKLVAVEVPGSVKFGPVARFLEKGEESGKWRYEEGVFRHQIDSA
jgi:hypothetical protein